MEANRRKRVLIVDDNQSLLDLLEDGLADRYEVVLANNGVDGLTQFFAFQPDCVVIDIKMPGLDGFSLVRTLRGDPDSAATPLIVLTALAQDTDRYTGMASGADQYLTKPVLPSELIPIIEAVIALSAGERMARLQALAEAEPPSSEEE